MENLLTRLFVQWRSSLDGAALVVIAWLSSNGFDLSEANKAKVTAWIALLAAAVWKFFSSNPAPEPEKEIRR